MIPFQFSTVNRKTVEKIEKTNHKYFIRNN